MESQGIGSCSNIDGLRSACVLKKMQQDLPVHVYGVGGVRDDLKFWVRRKGKFERG